LGKAASPSYNFESFEHALEVFMVANQYGVGELAKLAAQHMEKSMADFLTNKPKNR